MESRGNFLRQVLSQESLLVGLSLFWRCFLLLHLPYFVVWAVHRVAYQLLDMGGESFNKGMLIILLAWGLYLAWAVVIGGVILRQLWRAYGSPEGPDVGLLRLGLRWVRISLIGSLILLLPSTAVSFAAGALVGFVLGLHGLAQQSTGAGLVAGYVASSALGWFVFGYLVRQAIWEGSTAVDEAARAPEGGA